MKTIFFSLEGDEGETLFQLEGDNYSTPLAGETINYLFEPIELDKFRKDFIADNSVAQGRYTVLSVEHNLTKSSLHMTIFQHIVVILRKLK